MTDTKDHNSTSSFLGVLATVTVYTLRPKQNSPAWGPSLVLSVFCSLLLVQLEKSPLIEFYPGIHG